MSAVPPPPSLAFPVYRRRAGGASVCAIEGPERMVEYQRLGSRWLRQDLVASAYPEKLLIQDLLNLAPGVEALEAAEFQAVERAAGDAGDGDGAVGGCAVGEEAPEWVADADLGARTTFGVPGRARWMVSVRSDAEVRAVLAQRAAMDPVPPLLVLGGGSNLLLHSDWDGLVMKMEVPGKTVRPTGAGWAEGVAGAGERWHDWVDWTLTQGWAGLENLAWIPGSVGAAPMQNIGAYGVELKDVFAWLEAIRIEDGALRRFQPADCSFGYRESVFKGPERGRWVITRVAFRLQDATLLETSDLRVQYGAVEQELAAVPRDRWTPRHVADAVIRIRQSKLPDPQVLGNAGSFFKNPVISAPQFAELQARFPDIAHHIQPDGQAKLAAAWLIEHAGWKGHNRVTHGVHDRQALVLVNRGGATGAQIWELAQDIRKDVLSQYGVELEPEVNQVGATPGSR